MGAGRLRLLGGLQRRRDPGLGAGQAALRYCAATSPAATRAGETARAACSAWASRRCSRTRREGFRAA